MASILLNKTVLVVEDDNITNIMMTRMLKKYFKDVISSYDANNAYKNYIDYNPDLIISDIEMPKQSGLELFKKIRKHDKSIPVIIMTSYTDQKYLLEAVDLQVLFYLVKPIEKENFNKMIKKIRKNFEEDVQDKFYFNDKVYYDFKRKIIESKTKYKSLTNNEIEILEELIKNKNSVLSSEYFEIKLGLENSNALKLNISRLRKKIPKNTIETVYSRGYILNYNSWRHIFSSSFTTKANSVFSSSIFICGLSNVSISVHRL